MENVVTAVLGGGQGKRLWPLTQFRAKPAVPLAGKFRLIDIPITNSLQAGIGRIYVLTQFNSASLHRHIAQTYRFDAFRNGFVNILAAEQGVEHRDWYQGTADAVRQNLRRLTHTDPSDVLILSGDQLYQMNLRALLERHRSTKSELTIAVCAVPKSEVEHFGVMRIDSQGRIVDFAEKPKEPHLVDSFVAPGEALEVLGLPAGEETCLASMGIYVFSSGILHRLLDGTETKDFGREVIPQAIHEYRVHAFGYPGYWRDIGTVASFHEANLELTQEEPPLHLYSEDAPIYSRPRFLPPTRIENCRIKQSLIAEGGRLRGARIDHCVIGIRARIDSGSLLERSILMGATRYEEGSPEVPLGVGKDCEIRNAIVDLDARVGDGSRLVNREGLEEADHSLYSIRGGIIVVPRGVVVPPGTVV